MPLWEERRGSLEFEIDGVVVKVNRSSCSGASGVVGREPRWAIAWKFPPTTAVTKLNDIGWNPGKFGDLHPYAMLEPVHVGGVTIKLATLHNEEDLARKDIRIGEEVIVLRAGDVIPQVLSPAPARGRARRPPAIRRIRRSAARSATPRRSSPRDSVFTRCPNRDCPGRRWQLLKHFVGAMDIDGLGEKQVSLFMDLGWVQTAGDFYRLDAEQIAGQTGFGQVSAEKLVNARSRRPSSSRSGGCCSRSGSRRSATSPAATWPSSSARSTRCSTPAPRRSSRPRASARRWRRAIHAQLADEQMRALIEDLREEGLRLEEEGPPPGEGPLAGKTFVLTGTLPNLTREQATEMIVAAGRQGHRSVSRKTDYLVAGESPGSKLAQAERLEVPVLDEDGLPALF